MKPYRVFIIQPYGAAHSDRFKELIQGVCKSSSGEFEAFRADDEQTLAGPRLQDRIDSYIKKSHICVADLTGTRNENALLEVGAAYTLSIPVIPVSDRDLPSDIRGNLRISLDVSQVEKEAHQEEFRRALRRRLQEATKEIGLHSASQFVAFGYESRRNVDLYTLINSTQKRIDILTTNLGFVVNEELEYGLNSERLTVLQMLASALNSKPQEFRLRILALDPDSNFTNDRALALGRERRVFREQMFKDLDTVVEFARSRDCVRWMEIRLYNEFPYLMTYFFDDYLISSVVTASLSSRECVTYGHNLQVRGAKETYERHFENLWGRATSVATSSALSPTTPNWRRSTQAYAAKAP